MGKLVVLWGKRERGPNRSVIFLLLTGALIVAPPIKTGSRWLQERICTGTTARNSPTQGGSLSLFLIFCLFNQKKKILYFVTLLVIRHFENSPTNSSTCKSVVFLEVNIFFFVCDIVILIFCPSVSRRRRKEEEKSALN